MPWITVRAMANMQEAHPTIFYGFMHGGHWSLTFLMWTVFGGNKVMAVALDLSSEVRIHVQCSLYLPEPEPSLPDLELTPFNRSGVHSTRALERQWTGTSVGLEGWQPNQRDQHRRNQGPSTPPWQGDDSGLAAYASDVWNGQLCSSGHHCGPRNTGNSLEFLCPVLKINSFPPWEAPPVAK